MENEDVKRLLRTLLTQLRQAGVHVKVTSHRTTSLYLHLEHDILKEIRISDHAMGTKSQHRVGYDILISRNRHRKYLPATRCYQYGAENALTVVDQVILDRDHKVLTMGAANYRQLVQLAQRHPQLPQRAAAFETKLGAFFDSAPTGGGRRNHARV